MPDFDHLSDEELDAAAAAPADLARQRADWHLDHLLWRLHAGADFTSHVIAARALTLAPQSFSQVVLAKAQQRAHSRTWRRVAIAAVVLIALGSISWWMSHAADQVQNPARLQGQAAIPAWRIVAAMGAVVQRGGATHALLDGEAPEIGDEIMVPAFGALRLQSGPDSLSVDGPAQWSLVAPGVVRCDLGRLRIAASASTPWRSFVTPDLTAHIVGTRFEVVRDFDRTHVAVQEGTVQLVARESGSAALAHAGAQWRCNGRTLEPRPPRFGEVALLTCDAEQAQPAAMHAVRTLGRWGDGIGLSEPGQFFACRADTALRKPATLTVSWWMVQYTAERKHLLIAPHADATSDATLCLVADAAWFPQAIRIGYSGVALGATTTPAFGVSPGRMPSAWIHYAAVFSGDELTMYAKGVAVHAPLQLRPTSTPVPPTSSLRFVAGRAISPCVIDDLRVYDRVLSAAEIAALARE